MDNIKKYQDTIVEFLTSYAEEAIPANVTDFENQVIIDKENHHYQLLQIGWQGNRYIFAVLFHFDIKNGKIWFQINNTEREVVDELMAKGVPAEDIVLGFQPPYARPYTGFAVA